MADLASGIYHWAMDNYGNAKTPIFGSLIESFQIHHEQPWAFTKSQLAYKLYVQAAVVTAVISPVNLFSSDPVVLGFAGRYAGCLLFSQQFHAWAHTPKGKLPAVVVALQGAGIILGKGYFRMCSIMFSQQFHSWAYTPKVKVLASAGGGASGRQNQFREGGNYCIVSGVWNRFL
ncbi:hypothetical protein BUALT_Bualt18G0066700 [Buddleja alternifolia]|uniref:Lipid desaturase domain-containing protein n=1 Tax=Buddleja alternifolia TaxID=168488 RepID=A0AAV6W9E3_9LAMI|nr:hypothetical protein BUALT_Bualt18G0066700 [Buddleja alternifolia]